MNPPSDFSDNELKMVRDMLARRYGKPVELQLADVEFQIDKDRAEWSACPAVFWQAREANLIIFKTGDERFSSQFFYDEDSVFGTGIDEYDDLSTCVSTLLQVQADDERARAMSADSDLDLSMTTRTSR